MRHHLIAYDISDNRRRAAVASTLLANGVRVQKSVFEVTADQKSLERLLARLLTLIDPRTDQIRAYPLDSAALRGLRVLGHQPDRPAYWLVV